MTFLPHIFSCAASCLFVEGCVHSFNLSTPMSNNIMPICLFACFLFFFIKNKIAKDSYILEEVNCQAVMTLNQPIRGFYVLSKWLLINARKIAKLGSRITLKMEGPLLAPLGSEQYWLEGSTNLKDKTS